jgi:hypothetical protein
MISLICSDRILLSQKAAEINDLENANFQIIKISLNILFFSTSTSKGSCKPKCKNDARDWKSFCKE